MYVKNKVIITCFLCIAHRTTVMFALEIVWIHVTTCISELVTHLCGFIVIPALQFQMTIAGNFWRITHFLLNEIHFVFKISSIDKFNLKVKRLVYFYLPTDFNPWQVYSHASSDSNRFKLPLQPLYMKGLHEPALTS